MRALSAPLLVVLAAITSAWAASASSARAQDALMAAYRSICFDTHGDTQKALAVADAAGWRPAAAPAEAAQMGVTMREKWVGSDHWELMVVAKDLPLGDAPFPTRMATCIASVSPAAPDAGPALQAMMGRDPSATDGGKVMWAYYEHDGARDFNVQLPAQARIAALRAGPFVMVGAIHGPQGAALSYMMLVKTGAP